jgi:hypothetical protein
MDHFVDPEWGGGSGVLSECKLSLVVSEMRWEEQFTYHKNCIIKVWVTDYVIFLTKIILW